MNNEEIQEQIENLKREVENIRRDTERGLRGDSQFTFPIDPQTQRIIENNTIYPITVRLKNTDAATATNYGTFFVSDRQYNVLAVAEVHGTAGSDGGSVTLQIERLQGTEAPDSGDALLTTAFNLKGTADTVQYGTLTNTGGVSAIQRGDRLCLKDAGTLTAVANLVVTVYIQPA